MEVFQLIIEDANKETTTAARSKLLNEFLEKSAPFLKDYPAQAPIWALRAVALELGEGKVGWEAGRAFTALGEDKQDAPKMRRVLAMLDRKGWLTEKEPSEDQLFETARAEFSGRWQCTQSGHNLNDGSPKTFGYVMDIAYSDGVLKMGSKGDGWDNPLAVVPTDNNAHETGEASKPIIIQNWWDGKTLHLSSTGRGPNLVQTGETMQLDQGVLRISGFLKTSGELFNDDKLHIDNYSGTCRRIGKLQP